MPYVSGGRVVEQRSPWRLSIFTDIFWSTFNLLHAFVATLFSPIAEEDYIAKQRGGNRNQGGGRAWGGSSGGGGGGGGPGGGGGGGGRGGNPRISGMANLRTVAQACPPGGG